MSRKLVLITIFLITAMIISLFIVLLFSKNKPNQTNITLPTPTPVSLPYIPTQEANPSPTPLQIVKTQPDNEEKNISLNQLFIITCNRNISASEISLSTNPQFDYTTEIAKNTLIIKPKNQLQPNTTYLLYIATANPQITTTLSFSTIGDNPIAPNTYSGIHSTQDYYAGDQPVDMFLANRTPYDTDSFAITNDYTTDPNGHFFFTIQLKGADTDASKQNVITWLHSIGITDQYREQLDIRYE